MSPVNSHVRPIPGMSPGYGDEVIFADGTFIDGRYCCISISRSNSLLSPYAVPWS
jgi:cystathionine beta-lyase family protein involved in aluminum resistance